MCPGLTHPNAKMTAVGENTVVAIMAEGKDHALAIGKTVMSTQVTLERGHSLSCISTSECIVENDKKRSKMIKNILFSSCV